MVSKRTFYFAFSFLSWFAFRGSLFIAQPPRFCSGELLPKLNISKSFWFQGLVLGSDYINNINVYEKTEPKARLFWKQAATGFLLLSHLPSFVEFVNRQNTLSLVHFMVLARGK